MYIYILIWTAKYIFDQYNTLIRSCWRNCLFDPGSAGGYYAHITPNADLYSRNKNC